MTMKPLRILALVAVATWCGGRATRGQQYQPSQQYQPMPYAAPAPSMGPPQFQPNRMPGGVMPAAYYQGGSVNGGMNPGGAMPGAVYDAGSVQGLNYGQGATYGQPTSGGYYGDPAVQGSSYGDYGGDTGNGYLEALGEQDFSHECYSAGHCYAYTRAETFYLKRDIRSNIRFTSLGPASPASALNVVLQTDDLNFEYEPGIRGVAGIPLSDCLALEASYFGLQEWTDTAAAVDPVVAGPGLFSNFSAFGARPIVINGVPFTDVPGLTRQEISYRSEIHNAELNLLGRYNMKNPKQELWFFAGARYIKIDEQFNFNTASSLAIPLLGDRSFTAVDTDNDMVGFQLGGIFNHFVTKRVRVSFDGRAAVMSNFSEVHTLAGTNLFLLGDERMRDETVAFATDGGVSLSWDVNCWLSVTGGYRVMFIDGAAMAARNFNEVLLGTDVRVPFQDTEGSILMQGATAGVEVRW